MKILHVSPRFSWTQIFIEPIAQLQADENEVWISTLLPNRKEVKKGKVIYISKSAEIRDFYLYFKSIIPLLIFIKQKKIDRVFFHSSTHSLIYIFFCLIFRKLEVVYVNHGVTYVGYKGLKRFIFKTIEVLNIAMSDKCFSITQGMTLLLEKVNVFKKKIETFTPGTICGIQSIFDNYQELLEKRVKFEPNNEGKTRILFVGRLEARKGIYELLEAVSKTNLNCELLILGEGKLQTKDYDSNKVKVLGYKTNLDEYYLSADFLCVPSYHEGFGQVYLEAASYGVIPICSDIVGPTDFIKNGVNGFCVKPKNAESIITLFNKINSNDYSIEKMRETAYNSSKLYDSSIVLKNNLKLFL